MWKWLLPVIYHSCKAEDVLNSPLQVFIKQQSADAIFPVNVSTVVICLDTEIRLREVHVDKCYEYSDPKDCFATLKNTWKPAY